jgi:hypothetical protein
MMRRIPTFSSRMNQLQQLLFVLFLYKEKKIIFLFKTLEIEFIVQQCAHQYCRPFLPTLNRLSVKSVVRSVFLFFVHSAQRQFVNSRVVFNDTISIDLLLRLLIYS